MSSYRYRGRRSASQSLARSGSDRPRPRPKLRIRIAQLALIAVLTATATSALAREGPIDLELYARLLESHTRSVDDIVGVRVDYRGLAKSPEWKTLVRQVSSARPSQSNRQGQIAYWINAYNILAIDMVVRNGPVESIRDIGNFIVPVWNRDAGTVAGNGVSLDGIEHEILRSMGEPRIHAAIVCAANSCPNLRREAYRADGLDAQLADNMRAWLARPEKGMRLDRERGVLHLSRIFDWFDDDFEGQGGVVAVVTRHAPERDREWLRLHAAALEIEYLDYDWQLNE
jgi:hypothetical protein